MVSPEPVPTEPVAGTDRAPPALRRLGRTLLGVVSLGALALVVVRREAILVDLANFAAWCF